MLSGVAPRAGAWIEAPHRATGSHLRTSLPVRERGLKHALLQFALGVAASLPVRERGLKHLGLRSLVHIKQSLPVRERGLKLLLHEGH